MAGERRRLAALRRLHRVQKVRADLAAAELVRAEAAVTHAQRELADAREGLRRFEEGWVAETRAVERPFDLELLGARHELAIDNIRDAQLSVTKQRRATEPPRAQVTRTRRAVSRTEVLIDRARAELQAESARAEQTTLDDLAAARRKADP